MLLTDVHWSSLYSVVTALRARQALGTQKIIGDEREIDIIDLPYLSDIPKGLSDVLSSGQYEFALFADICKSGPGSNILSSTIMGLQKDRILPARWNFVAAPRTYNPLGNIITFLNEDDIIKAYRKMIS